MDLNLSPEIRLYGKVALENLDFGEGPLGPRKGVGTFLLRRVGKEASVKMTGALAWKDGPPSDTVLSENVFKDLSEKEKETFEDMVFDCFG